MRERPSAKLLFAFENEKITVYADKSLYKFEGTNT